MQFDDCVQPRAGVRWSFWVAHAAFWALAFGASMLLAAAFAVDDPPAFIALEIGLCAAATAAMRLLSARPRRVAGIGVPAAGLVAAGLLLAAVVITIVLLATRSAFGLPPATWAELGARFSLTFGMLGTWYAFYFGTQLTADRYVARIRLLEAESRALRSELEHLQAQISPHFLFNSLNTVIAHRDDPEAIDTVTQSLARYLDFLLRPAGPLEPLAREIDALEDYLTVQGMRFGDALESRIDCDADARRIAVLPVMVQPLVENAIKHGARSSPRPLRVHVAARRQGDWLTVEVANTGRWVPPSESPAGGTGLSSLERRLRMVVGSGASVTHREEDGWVRAVIRVPAVEAAPAAAASRPAAGREVRS